ncbi:MAG: 2-(1,2-epoxy-1,2-dihydrophenyl)acetyl-CoA isomerase [Porticoccaceae bacterium]|jgi:2-(1,2-epoxy-1,2-dihydrophenyl)acetyl-CoA isomerase
MPDYQSINLSVTNRVATLAFNSPKTLNALHQKMRLELIDAVHKVEADEEVRVVILTGLGRSFCAGADLSEGMPGYTKFVDQCAAEYKPWLMAIHNSEKLYVAAVNGAAAGIGAATVMNCDLVLMADDSYLYQAFSAIGLMPDGGATWLLLQKLGYQRAIDMAVNAGRLSAQQCLELGLANRVVSAESLIDEAQAWAEQMAQGAPLAQAAVKKLMRNATSMSYAEVVDQEAVEQSKLIESDDSRNAIAAFFAKRKAVFKGK